MSKKKKLASVSLDLDNQWAYMRTHGDEGWESFPSYFETAVPRILKFLDQRKTKITFFIVGQDAALEKNHASLKQIADAGHELGNHSFNHEPWLHLYSDEQLAEEFDKTEAAILEATGKRPRGFRGPGFSFSKQVLQLLADRNYVYDASTFPTFLGPVARMYYLLTGSFSKQEKEDRKQLYGTFAEGFRPNKPFLWKVGDPQLLEMPVTTMPLVKVPIHATYIVYLASFSMLAARMYFWKAMKVCWLFGVQPSFLLHPTDFMDEKDCPEMAFFPGMNVDSDKKIELIGRCLDMIEKHWRIVPMQEHAEDAMSRKIGARELPVASTPSPTLAAE